MKFAREYEAALRREGYPKCWVLSAISYRQLKKCIRRIELELSHIGLDVETLRRLCQSAETISSKGISLQYKLEGVSLGVETVHQEKMLKHHLGDLTAFEPKLLFLVSLNDGIPMDASLSPLTRAYLQSLVVNTQDQYCSDTSLVDPQRNTTRREELAGCTNCLISQPIHENQFQKDVPLNNVNQQDCLNIEVPLRHDSEFFQLLNLKLSELQALQSYERSELIKDIGALGREISVESIPSKGSGKSDFYTWREILSLYTDCRIFFSTNERDQFYRDSSTAQKQLQRFSEKLSEIKVAKRFRRKESYLAMDRFLYINLILLQNIKFQELNSTAITKILKSKSLVLANVQSITDGGLEFDKRTALGARQTFPELIPSEVLFSQSLAKSMCSKISEEIVSVVPQLNDYLCPVCFNISFKPIKLRCGHVFCIRCMIVLQKAKQDHCPLCRSSVVMQADSGELKAKL